MKGQHVPPPGTVGAYPPVGVPPMYVHAPLVFQDYPIQMKCPVCQNIVLTRLSYTTGVLTWLACGGLFLFGFALGCCLIPFCVDSLRDVNHFCPICNALLGSYKRI